MVSGNDENNKEIVKDSQDDNNTSNSGSKGK
jgi:hypothetical protein